MTTQPTRSPGSKALLTHLTVAGTAALAASQAHAQIVVTPVNVDIGPNGQSSFTSALPGSSQFTIGFNKSAGRNIQNLFGTTASLPGGYLRFKATRTALNKIQVLVKSPAGQKFNSAPGRTTSGNAFVRDSKQAGGTTTHLGYAPFTDGYFLFKFKDTTNGSQMNYGYIQASLTDDTYANMNLHITSYVYDASGAQIAAGAQPAAVPEPGAAVALAAFGALTLGAVGVRRLKALQA